MKRAITTLCFGQALKRSCVHKMQVTFNNRLTALSKATFLNSLLKSVAEPLPQNLEESTPTSTQEPVSGVVRGQMCDLSAQDEPQFEKKKKIGEHVRSTCLVRHPQQACRTSWATLR